MVDVPDVEFARMRQKAVIGDFAEALYNDPNVGDDLRRIIKQAKPTLKIPEWDLEQKLTKRLDKEKEEREEAEKKRRQEESDRELMARIKAVAERYSLTDNGTERVIETMHSHQIADPEAAAELVVARQGRATTPHYSDGLWHHDRGKDFDEIMKDPIKWARKEIHEGLTK